MVSDLRFGISWGVMGALEDCVNRALAYSLERKQFGRPIGSFQLVQKKLVDAQTEVALGLLASLQVRVVAAASRRVAEADRARGRAARSGG